MPKRAGSGAVLRFKLQCVNEKIACLYFPRGRRLLYCNLRLSEVVALNLDDVAADKFPVRGKGRREREAFLTPPAHEALTNYLPSRATLLRKLGAETDALFNRRDGHRLTGSSVHRIVKAIAYAKGLPKYISPVKLRGACATQMLDGGHLYRPSANYWAMKS